MEYQIVSTANGYELFDVENNRIGYNCLYETEQDAIDAAEMLGYPWAAEFESVEWSPNRGKITLVSLSPEE